MGISVPILPSRDLVVAKEFYVDTLGFLIIFDSSNGGTSGIVGLEREGMRINLDSPMEGHGRNACVSLEVNDLDSLYTEWSARMEGLHPPVDQSWGARTFEFQDPDDNTIFVVGSAKW